MKPKKGDMFACTQGSYLGANLVLINDTKETYKFLNLPEMLNIDISKNDVKTGIETGILELLESLPADIIKVCEAQYEKNTNT